MLHVSPMTEICETVGLHGGGSHTKGSKVEKKLEWVRYIVYLMSDIQRGWSEPERSTNDSNMTQARGGFMKMLFWNTRACQIYTQTVQLDVGHAD